MRERQQTGPFRGPDHDRDLTEELTDPDRVRSKECSSNLMFNYLRLRIRLNKSVNGIRVN